MSDPFKGRETGLTDPATRAFAITPSDTVDLSVICRGIHVGTAGDLRVLLSGDSAPVTLSGLAGGAIHALRIRRVYATGTTAGALVGVY